MIKTILVPVAPMGTRPHVERALWLARRTNAVIVLVTVHQSSDQTHGEDHEFATMAASDPTIRVLTRIGDPANEILESSRQESVDLIVMRVDQKWHMENTWSAERAFHRFLLKSTVAKVVQEANCPVWLEPTGSRNTWEISNVICFVDLRINCERLIHFASRIAKELDTRMLLFHSTVSARLFAPGQPRNVVELQRYHVEVAEGEINALKSQCEVDAETIVTSGDEVAGLSHTLKQFASPLVVLERVSGRWGENNKLFQIIRYCMTPMLIRTEAVHVGVAVCHNRKRVDPIFVLMASIGIGVSIIYLAMYLATHTDQCHFAEIRCQTPASVLFGNTSDGQPAAAP